MVPSVQPQCMHLAGWVPVSPISLASLCYHAEEDHVETKFSAEDPLTYYYIYLHHGSWHISPQSAWIAILHLYARYPLAAPISLNALLSMPQGLELSLTISC